MSISFDIDGLDNLEKVFRDIERGAKTEELEFWANRISNDLKISHPEYADQITIDVSNNEGDSQFHLKMPNEIKNEAIKVIRNYLNEMPVITSAVFESLINILEEE